MCIGIPMRVLSCEGSSAVCDHDGQTCMIDMRLVGEVEQGTWVLTFMGAAREVMSDEAARTIQSALKALDAVMHGESVDLDACFADLIQREPELPEHLRKTGDQS